MSPDILVGNYLRKRKPPDESQTVFVSGEFSYLPKPLKIRV
jgi:hypothetical protein